jgi:hypothetical protein
MHQQTPSAQELQDRLDLIERMIMDARRSTERWGWAFALWGVAFYVAMLWAAWRPSPAAWPVTMACALVVTLVIGQRNRGRHPGTSMGWAIKSVWTAAGISMFLIFSALGFTGRMDAHSFVAVAAAMLGAANAASGMILKWKMQMGCAVVWWAVSVAACFGSARELSALFLAAIFVCQIVFGICAMVGESQRLRQSGAAHA